jgi:hypothetical protein
MQENNNGAAARAPEIHQDEQSAISQPWTAQSAETEILQPGIPPIHSGASANSGETSLKRVDPFDPMNLGISTDYAAAINAQASAKPVELRKPNDQEFFRTSPNEHQRLTVGGIADKQDMGRVFIVSPVILDQVKTRFPKQVRVYELVLTVTLLGTALLWPKPLGDDRGGQWHSTERSADDSGRRKWTNMSSARGRYEFVTADNPKPVNWDSLPPFCELLRQACSERIIESLDHPLLRKLSGETE